MVKTYRGIPLLPSAICRKLATAHHYLTRIAEESAQQSAVDIAAKQAAIATFCSIVWSRPAWQSQLDAARAGGLPYPRRTNATPILRALTEDRSGWGPAEMAAEAERMEDTILWLHAHARARLGADPSRLTVSGASAGGTLAFAAATKFHGTDRAMRRVVTLFAPVDLRVPPWEKRKPAGFPKFDVSLPLQPLFDLYASEARKSGYAKSPRLSTILADPATLPDEVLMIVPTMDILLDEQLAFAERLRECEGKKVEVRLFEGQLHGFIDLPSFMIGATTRQEAFDAVASFVWEERLNGM
ncbi:hypothetical protein LTR53_005446 [Teratosphaeriaceae sp. CCFEE 6253]|nr:hypothetical protein LTR53_005446 [Teratosphaeriaceae sp. CCFEE 6253]